MEFRHELIIPNEDLPFKMFIFEGKNGNYVREKHWHRSVEIFAVFEGNLEFCVNEHTHVLEAGEFIIVNSNEVHSILSPNKNLTVVIQIPLSAFENYYTGERYVRFLHEPDVPDKHVMELVREMYNTYGEKKCGYDLCVQSSFYRLMYLLVTKYRELKVSDEQLRQNKNLTRLSMITGYIRENYTKELSLESLAEIFGYSPTYLSKMFRKYAQTNYKSYLQNVRVEYAAKELRNTDHTVSEIAENHGFPNHKAFSNAFRQKYGLLPSEYRKRM